MLQLKPCILCGAEVPKKKYESVARYNGKKFCSQICAKKYMKDNKIGWFSPDTFKSKSYPKERYNDSFYATETTND